MLKLEEAVMPTRWMAGYNLDEAEKWLVMAAQQGNPAATANLDWLRKQKAAGMK